MSVPVNQSLKEYARGVAGGLLFSLPLLYTMEVWWAGFVAGPLRLVVYMLVSFLLLIGYNRYAGIHEDHTYAEVVIESIEEMGLGLLGAALILWLLGLIAPGMGWSEIVGKVVVEAMTVAIGVSVGTAQLGGNQEEKHQPGKRGAPGEPHFRGQLVIALCGAVLIAANVAPTEEIILIGVGLTAFQLVLLALVSMGVGAGILYYSDFRGTRRWVRLPGGHYEVVIGTVILYAIALTSSAFMLWFFDRFDGNAALTNLGQTVVLAFPASLGASAGRLLLQGG